MLIDFSQTIKDLLGNDVMEATADGGTSDKPMTFGGVCATTLVNMDQSDRALSGAVKIQRYQLAMKVVRGGPVEITSSEAVMMADCVSRATGPLIVGQVVPVLEGGS